MLGTDVVSFEFHQLGSLLQQFRFNGQAPQTQKVFRSISLIALLSHCEQVRSSTGEHLAHQTTFAAALDQLRSRHCHPDELQENLDAEESLFRSPWTNHSRNFEFHTEI
ncbi:hypothetical protein TNIN_111041 [Trichonephila inaurata madagascariensis]|uniref:Uncharacterized protein n=1 Tax=Trichonephila inaurata madagascariensis TaxID=2747483 RepID=A0A8X6XFH8_9ARAC|nr:hypothetical protein TNIN_111041 [Trichonephila inaurata madagascariensis]